MSKAQDVARKKFDRNKRNIETGRDPGRRIERDRSLDRAIAEYRRVARQKTLEARAAKKAEAEAEAAKPYSKYRAKKERQAREAQEEK